MSKQLIDIITKTSFQVIKSAGFTKKDEFIDVNEKKIPEGIPYHIHRTRDKREYYMTSAQHETNSILIFKKNNKTDFFRYKTLTNRKSQLYLQENRTIPTETDYEKGFINLYFARQANDKKSKIFQINENDYKQDTPFYEKITLRLKITGNEDNVFAENNSVIEAQDVFYPGISLVISPLSYYQESRFSTSSPSSTSGGSSGGSSSGGGGGY
tara:strand:- start:577 stop:1212 length:636 start_codon:yes stop_codon:yes gene_type:complete